MRDYGVPYSRARVVVRGCTVVRSDSVRSERENTWNAAIVDARGVLVDIAV